LSLVTATASSVNRDALRSGNAPRGRKTGDVGALLDGDRHAEQRAAFAACQRPVRLDRHGPCTLEIAHHDRIELVVVRLDARDRAIEQFDRRDLPRLQQGRELPRAPIIHGLASLVAARYIIGRACHRLRK